MKNNKLSHVAPNVVTSILNILKGDFRVIVISIGSKHSFLGINITIRDENKV